ncbi:hypothetical protein NL676_005866 [Syzygium grande]|nr:hypothetical protein NL676_005866 [Syzygium grande]
MQVSVNYNIVEVKYDNSYILSPPQAEVLGHAAIGGFVSHCGWNSILESLWHGVLIVTWPIYAEQQLNAFMMLKELGLAEELRLDHKGHGVGGNLVQAEEIERAVGR